MKSTYLMDLDEEAIGDFMKDHEELYDKTGQSKKGLSLGEVPKKMMETHN